MYRKFGLILFVFLLGCAPLDSKISVQQTPTGNNQIAMPTVTEIPTLTPTLISTPTVIPTATQTPSPTPTLYYPVSRNTPWPLPQRTINEENIDELKILASWGYGLISDVIVSPDQSIFAVSTYSGFFLYDSQTLNLIKAISTQSPVISMAFSPDMSMIATGHSDNTILLWKISTNELVKTLKYAFKAEDQAKWSGVNEIRFSGDGQHLESYNRQAYYGNYVKIWDITSGQDILTFNNADSCTIKVSPASAEYAISDSNSIKIIQIADGNIRAELPISLATEISYSPDGKVLAVLSGSSITIFNPTDGKLLKKITGNSIEFSPDSRFLGVTSGNGYFQSWVIEHPDLNVIPGNAFRGVGFGDHQNCSKKTFLYVDNPHQGTFSSDGSLVALLQDGWTQGRSYRLLIYRVDDKSLVNTIMVPPDGDGFRYPSLVINKVLISKNTAISLSRDIWEGQSILRFWDVQTNKLSKEINPIGPVMPVAFSPDDKSMVSYSPDGGPKYLMPSPFTEDNHIVRDINLVEISLWDISQGKTSNIYETAHNPNQAIDFGHHASFSGDGNYFSFDGYYDSYANTWKINSTNPPIESGYKTYSLGTLEAEAIGNDILISKNGNSLLTLKGHLNPITSITFSQDEKMLASGDRNGEVIIWDLVNGQLISKISNAGLATHIKISSDNQYAVIVAGDQIFNTSVKLWDVKSGRMIKELDSGWVISSDFSPDGTLLASINQSGYSSVLKIFTVKDAKVIRSISLPNCCGKAHLSFSHNGKMIAVTLQSALQIWGIENEN